MHRRGAIDQRARRRMPLSACACTIHVRPAARARGAGLTEATFAFANHYMWALRPSHFSGLGDEGQKAREGFWRERIITATEAPTVIEGYEKRARFGE
ncbi:hypothetical protein MTO96_015375 [Rhipicephalus appendiculatus]